ncbi:MAG: heavy-metal-associated domain-containing protein [Blastocatellia bacterium]|nr:heavy-metal-associated domain-containing protein [Blastocatellia bacterium]
MLVEFRVTGMHCTSCKNLIEEELAELSGVNSIAVDLAAGQAKINYDCEKVSLEEIMEKVSDLGYEAAKIA